MSAKLLFVAVALVAAASCGKSVNLVATASGPATLQVGATATYTAVVTADGAASPTGPGGGYDVAWSSSDSTIATVTHGGFATAIKAGQVTFTVTPILFGTGTRTPGSIAVTVVN